MITESELEVQLRAIASRLGAIHQAMPETSGLAQAFDRGNITRDEWEEATAATEAGLTRERHEVALLTALRDQHAVAMARYVDALVSRLELRAGAADVVACLRGWSTGAETRHSPAWAWRVVYGLVDAAATR